MHPGAQNHPDELIFVFLQSVFSSENSFSFQVADVLLSYSKTQTTFLQEYGQLYRQLDSIPL